MPDPREVGEWETEPHPSKPEPDSANDEGEGDE